MTGSVASIVLLVLSQAWHIPMMLWDHLDLMSMYDHVWNGRLAASGLWDIHGGHLHSSAYVILLSATWLSGGQPWLDALVSWILLVAYAAIIIRISARRLPHDTTGRLCLATIVMLALYPAISPTFYGDGR